MFSLQPRYRDDVQQTAEAVVTNLSQLQERYSQVAAKVIQGDASLAPSLAGAL